MLDFFIFIIVLIFSILGFFRGFNKELKSIFVIILFIILYSPLIDYFENYLPGILNITNYNFPDYLYFVFSVFIIYIFTSVLVFIASKIFFKISILSQNILLNKSLGFFAGLIKSVAIIVLILLIADHHNNLDYIINFDKNSLFIDYFLKFGVQLPNVWNHWYS